MFTVTAKNYIINKVLHYYYCNLDLLVLYSCISLSNTNQRYYILPHHISLSVCPQIGKLGFPILHIIFWLVTPFHISDLGHGLFTCCHPWQVIQIYGYQQLHSSWLLNSCSATPHPKYICLASREYNMPFFVQSCIALETLCPHNKYRQKWVSGPVS